MFRLLPALCFHHISKVPKCLPPFLLPTILDTFARRNIEGEKSLGGQFRMQKQHVRKGLSASSTVTILPLWIYLFKKDTGAPALAWSMQLDDGYGNYWHLVIGLVGYLHLTSLMPLGNSHGHHAGRSYYYSNFSYLQHICIV